MSMLDWHPCNTEFARSLSACTENPNTVYYIDPQSVDLSLTAMPGFYRVYASSYIDPIKIAGSPSAADGHFVTIRNDTREGVKKVYRFYWLLTNDGMFYYMGPDKDFSHHHIKYTDLIDINVLEEEFRKKDSRSSD